MMCYTDVNDIHDSIISETDENQPIEQQKHVYKKPFLKMIFTDNLKRMLTVNNIYMNLKTSHSKLCIFKIDNLVASLNGFLMVKS